MSGKTKRFIYQIFDLVFWLIAALGVVFMLWLRDGKGEPALEEYLACFFLVLAIFLRIPVLIHELGHLFCGWLSGFKAVSVSLGLVRISRGGVKFNGYSSVAGATEMFPKSGKNVRARYIFHTLGGGIFNLLVGGVLLALYFCLPYHAALLFCGMFSLFCMYEGLRALYPVELRAGKTDGAVAWGMIKHKAEEEVTLRVLTAQGILYRGRYSDVPRELLFETPVVREDSPAFLALRFMRMQYLLCYGEKDAAREVLLRMKALEDYLPAEAMGELERYEGYFKGNFETKKEPLFGVNELEEKLKNDIQGGR